MNTFEISSLPSGYRIRLIPAKVSFFLKLILGFLTLVTIVAPITILFSENVSPGAVIGAIISVLCFLFLFRLFLWNAFGTEVFERDGHQIRHFTDYRYFKDELFRSEKAIGISLGYVNSPKVSGNEKEEYLLAFFEQKQEASLGNVKLTQLQVDSILKEIKTY